ncbi:hypothetical protein ASF62_16705 [Leifsonia sp. Leaf325]|nr:phage holin family protein [Leifsonia sp. Leaf325]KQQ93332.1 hypothetical protein ASF62_16705 [Leifsonia sp. Leaf325]
MVRILIRAAIFLGSAALGLLVASLIIPEFHLHTAGFFVAIVVFALVQAAVEWLVRRLTRRQAPVIAGIAGLLSTFIALLVASLFTDGLSFDGIFAWILATVIVWVITALATWLLLKYVLPEPKAANAR